MILPGLLQTLPTMRVLVTIIVLFFAQSAMSADYYKYSIGGGGGVVKLTGGDLYKFDWDEAYGFTVGHWLSDRWELAVDYSFFTLANDTTVDTTGFFGNLTNNLPLEYRATRLGLMARRLLLKPTSKINLALGAGGGVTFWKMIDIRDNTTYTVVGSKGEQTDFAATELFLSGTAGISLSPVPSISLDLDVRTDYMTHAGAEFSDVVKSTLDRWLLGAQARLNFRFGGDGAKQPAWVSDSAWSSRRAAAVTRAASEQDGDADGVKDDEDRCLNTPRGVQVDKYGCAEDSDNDGVPDGLDNCPGTSPEARGQVDIFGCAIDSDFDGIADYLDACPANPVGAVVDRNGCPVDSDADGVPDGLDDCPYTLAGVAVDKYGCIDLSMFSEPMVLNIDYPSGSFEIDPHSKERLKKLAGLLNFVPDIKLEIHGFTDNIGTAEANRELSEKRANRVRDYLVTQGVSRDRMKVFGRGEENFVASNQTAEGRAKNRRIEIVFYR